MVQGILAEAATWLASKGIDQWPAAGFREAGTLRRIRQGSVYLAYAAGEPVATITLDTWADPELWKGASDDAGYVHRLAVRRPWAGRGIGAALLDWAGQRVAASGGRWLRLDCMRDNQPLHDYYLRLGFEHIRTIELRHRPSGSLFQRGAPSVRNGNDE
ncbi:MAG: GCN5-related N-acetyltransferase [Actinobacteria bacterium]|nr:GCN5-related N-acetyltransferase [Actinomycetota bacterium]MCW3043035.1 GCN5-related N-acetyltransferase [Actinomycetota bacterium]